MKRTHLSDEQVEQEIARLQRSPYVRLANEEQRLQDRRRMYLLSLQQLEKKGKELERSGITLEVLRNMYGTNSEYDYAE